MNSFDEIQGKSRRDRFEPEPLHVPAPSPYPVPQRQQDDEPLIKKDDRPGTHVVVIDIS